MSVIAIEYVPPGALRACLACRATRRLADFAPIDPGAGTIDRRRVCTPCIERVDAMLTVTDKPNVSAISREAGVSTKLVRQRREALGLPGAGHRHLADVERLTELSLAPDTTTAEIAIALNVEEYTVRRHQVALGLREPETKHRRADPDALVHAERLLRDDRASYQEAARTVGVGIDTIARHFPGLGWTGEDRATMASLLKNPDLRKLHLEFFRDRTA